MKHDAEPKYVLINDVNTLKKLNDAGKIVWPVDFDKNGKAFKYVDEISGIGGRFYHEGVEYVAKYHSGCFMPYLYLVQRSNPL